MLDSKIGSPLMQRRTLSRISLTLFACALLSALSACAQNTAVVNNNAQIKSNQNSSAQGGTAQNEPAVNWADGKLIIDGKEFKLNHAYATIDNDPFDENEYKIRVLLSEQPMSPDALSNRPSLMKMKTDSSLHAMEIDIDKDKKVTWIAIWGVGQVSGLEYPFEPAVFNDRMVEGRLYTAKAEKVFDKEWQYDAKFKATVSTDPSRSYVTARTGTPLPADGGEPGRAYMDYDAAIRKAKGPDELDAFYARAVREERNSVPDLKALFIEKESLLDGLKIVGGFADGDKATLSIEGSRDGERNVRGRINLHREEGQWKIGTQSYKSGD